MSKQHKGITVITCTADRPRAFELCERWGARTIEHFLESGGVDVQWIVADGGKNKVTCTKGQEHVLVLHQENLTLNILANMTAALAHARYEVAAFIEDDDWYAPDYLWWLSAMLTDDIDLVGEGFVRYYQLKLAAYFQHNNKQHASLSSTILGPRALDAFRVYLPRARNAYFDMQLWTMKLRGKIIAPAISLAKAKTHVVGIKGMPGRRGVGQGHQEQFYGGRKRDAKGAVLRRWLGAEDANVYLDLAAREWGRAD